MPDDPPKEVAENEITASGSWNLESCFRHLHFECAISFFGSTSLKCHNAGMGYWSSLLGLPSNQAANQAREIPNPIFLLVKSCFAPSKRNCPVFALCTKPMESAEAVDMTQVLNTSLHFKQMKQSKDKSRVPVLLFSRENWVFDFSSEPFESVF